MSVLSRPTCLTASLALVLSLALPLAVGERLQRTCATRRMELLRMELHHLRLLPPQLLHLSDQRPDVRRQLRHGARAVVRDPLMRLASGRLRLSHLLS